MWKTPPTLLSLTANRVHIWLAALDQPTLSLPELSTLLSADERVRADRYHFERDRERYIVGRGILRLILSRYLQQEPQDIPIVYGPHRKPHLGGDGLSKICFNLAHSNERALYALAYDRQIGIDLEYHHRIIISDELVQHYFSAIERKAFQTIPPQQQQALFFELWTLKEAYLKAVGVGLTQSLDTFSVISDNATGDNATGIEFVRFLHTITEMGSQFWSLKSLQPDDGYIGALAVQGNDANLDSNVDYWCF